MKGYKSGQQVEVEVYNFKERKSEWVQGVFIKKCKATDMPFRYSVEINGIILEGFGAAHPDCVRPVKGRSFTHRPRA